MADTITPGASDVNGLWTTYIIRKLVPGLKDELLFSDYAEPARIPAKVGGRVARWNIPTMFKYTLSGATSVDSAKLTAGTIQTKRDMVTITNVETTIEDYGDVIDIDDLANESAISEALDAYKDIVMFAGASLIDGLNHQAALASTNFYHCEQAAAGVGGAVLANGNRFVAADIPFIAGFFRGKNAKGWDSLSKDFMLAIHPDMESHMVSDVTTTELSWSEVNKHVPVGFQQLYDNHRFVGRLNGLSILRTTMVETVSEDVAAHRCVALSRWGVGWLGLGQSGPKSPSIKFKSPGPQSTNDTLDQIHKLGYKVRAASKLLDSNRVLVVYSAVT